MTNQRNCIKHRIAHYEGAAGQTIVERELLWSNIEGKSSLQKEGGAY